MARVGTGDDRGLGHIAFNGRLRLGLAGLGVGSTHFLPGVEAHSYTDVVAASDLRGEALDAFRQQYGGRTYATVEELCADPEVDVVWITTPNQHHARHAIMAAEHGKHVICTKPRRFLLRNALRCPPPRGPTACSCFAVKHTACIPISN